MWCFGDGVERKCFLGTLDWFERGSFFLHFSSYHQVEVFSILLWLVWRNRNEWIHKGSPKEANQLVETSGKWWYDFQSAQSGVEVSVRQSHVPGQRWRPPGTGNLYMWMLFLPRIWSQWVFVGWLGILRGLSCSCFCQVCCRLLRFHYCRVCGH